MIQGGKVKQNNFNYLQYMTEAPFAVIFYLIKIK
jgi:hypothetical protein